LLVLVIRSVVFNVLFYLNLLVQLIAALPTLVMPRGGILAVARSGRAPISGCCVRFAASRSSFAGWEKFLPDP